MGDAVEVLRKTKNVDYKKPLKVLQPILTGIEGVSGLTWMSSLCSPELTELCVSGDFCRGGSCRCRRSSERVFSAHHEGVAGSQVWNV